MVDADETGRFFGRHVEEVIDLESFDVAFK